MGVTWCELSAGVFVASVKEQGLRKETGDPEEG